MDGTDKKDLFAAQTTVSLALESWDRFKTPIFRVEPNLLGAVHSFTYQGRTIDITLPTISEAANIARVKLDHWRDQDGNGQVEPLDYLIHSVDVSVSLPDVHLFPSAILELPPNAVEVVTPEEQRRLATVVQGVTPLASGAFDLWIRCVRWKTGSSLLGRVAVAEVDTGWTTRLRDVNSGKTVWISAATLASPARFAISKTHWDSINRALTAGDAPPLSVDLLFDAEMHIEAGDFRRAVIDAAVAAEAYIRTMVRDTLPGALGDEAREFKTIREVLNNLFPKALLKRSKATCKVTMELHKIFDDRNKIVHGGKVADLSVGKCREHVAAVRELIADHLE